MHNISYLINCMLGCLEESTQQLTITLMFHWKFLLWPLNVLLLLLKLFVFVGVSVEVIVKQEKIIGSFGFAKLFELFF